MKKLGFALVFLFCAMWPLWALGQAGSGYEAGITAGYEFMDDDSALDDDLVPYGAFVGKRFLDKWLLEFVYERSEDADYVGMAKDTDLNRFGLKAVYEFFPEMKWVPYVQAGLGYQDVVEESADYDDGVFSTLGLGWKYKLTSAVNLLVEGRYLHDFQNHDNNLAALAGISFNFGAKAREIEEAAPPPPPAPKDSDGDGVADVADRCPGTPAGVAVDADGCPKDTDGDGVPDYLDRCPGTPGHVAVDEKGCPRDSDGDGVYDYKDRCPDTPSGVKVDWRGCPLDSDKDGVPDYLDRCPGTPSGFKVDSHGCPMSFDFQINFDTDSAAIKARYTARIKAFADFLRENPAYRAEIQGHTDSTGSRAYNKKLSQRRARAVMKKLIELGVDPARLSAVGYGEDRPIADNSTREGRAKNRRVVARLYY